VGCVEENQPELKISSQFPVGSLQSAAKTKPGNKSKNKKQKARVKRQESRNQNS